jgi:hypothetical protein
MAELPPGSRALVHCAANFRVSAFHGLYAMKHLGWSVERAEAFRAPIWDSSDDPVWEAFILQMQHRLTGTVPEAWESRIGLPIRVGLERRAALALARQIRAYVVRWRASARAAPPTLLAQPSSASSSPSSPSSNRSIRRSADVAHIEE